MIYNILLYTIANSINLENTICFVNIPWFSLHINISVTYNQVPLFELHVYKSIMYDIFKKRSFESLLNGTRKYDAFIDQV